MVLTSSLGALSHTTERLNATEHAKAFPNNNRVLARAVLLLLLLLRCRGGGQCHRRRRGQNAPPTLSQHTRRLVQ